jgi:glycerate dehydrogenase
MEARKNIVVLDGYTLNPAILIEDPLRSLGTLQVFDSTPEDQVIARAGDRADE